MRPVFADPKTDLVFKKLFGSEPHKPLLLALLNDLLELDSPHRIVDLAFVPTDQRPAVPELKLSVVDVQCTDAQGTQYVVEMQVLNVEGFERRVVYNTSKAYVSQLRVGDDYPRLHDVVGISICDFTLWPASHQPAVPLLSRWRLQEQHGGALGLSQVQYVFLELPKYAAGDAPQTTVDKWAYWFREAEHLGAVPAALAGSVQAAALEETRTARFSPDEWEAYDRAKVAEQDARGALTLAQSQGRDEGLRLGRDEGLRDGLRQAIADLGEVLGLTLTEAQRRQLAALDNAGLERLRAALKARRAWPDSF